VIAIALAADSIMSHERSTVSDTTRVMKSLCDPSYTPTHAFGIELDLDFVMAKRRSDCMLSIAQSNRAHFGTVEYHVINSRIECFKNH